jgi:ABC-type transporter Mla subunit MlaD
MPLQDLTPQLRTRLTKMERSVGWFVFLATALLLFGFGYYLYTTAEQKGWFLEKARFYTYVKSASDLKPGDPVSLMGFQVGEVTGISAMPPRTPHNVRIDFVINQVNQSGPKPVPYFGYVWSQGSEVKVNSASFLGVRGLDITRGTGGFNIYVTRRPQTLSWAAAQSLTDSTNWRLAQNVLDQYSNVVVRTYSQLVQSNLERMAELKLPSLLVFHVTGSSGRRIVAVWDESAQRYQDYNDRNLDATNAYELEAAESPAISDEIQAMVAQVKQALPNVLELTNKLAAVLDNAANATSNLNVAIAAAQPLVTNFAAISGDLHGPGALGTWVLGTNSSLQLERALASANVLLANTDTNLDQLTEQIGETLENVANITSNLNAQVQANSNMLGGISKTIMDTDTFIQGLKHHWLLRSAFKTKATNQPALKPNGKNPPPAKAK